MPGKTRLSRRAVLRKSIAAPIGVVGASACPQFARSEVLGVNERIRIGVIGTGVRGKYLIGNLPQKEAKIEAICDCAESRMANTVTPEKKYAEVLDGFRKSDGLRCRRYQDYRRMIDQEKLDAVIIAAPDHHHVPAAVRAMDAGLDVYLEKPLTVSIREGRLLSKKAKATGRVLQVGSQQRTMELNRFACEFVRDGGLGKIHRVVLPNYPGPLFTSHWPSEPVPEGLDWNLFLGPAPKRNHNRRLWVKDEFKVDGLVWRGWDHYRDFSGHLMTNWGAHSVDMMQFALGMDESGPVFIRALPQESVERIYSEWSHKTPAPGKEQHRFWPVEMRYANGVNVLFSGGNSAIRIHGERGIMKIRRNFFEVNNRDLITDGPEPGIANKWKGSGHVARPHLQNWIDCIRSRKPPNAPVEVGHRTATVCHLANLARELRESVDMESAKGAIHKQ